MEAPKKIKPTKLADYLEVMTKAAFQSGISWQVIEAKWDGFKKAFSKFDPKAVAGLELPDIDRLATDTQIVRNRKKIEATVHNARTLVDLDKRFGDFKTYLRSHDGFETLVADMKRRFKFLGDTGAYYFLYVVGEKVPPHEEWMKAHGARYPSRPKRPTRGGKR